SVTDSPSPDPPAADNPSAHSHSAADYPDSASRREVTWRSLPKDFLHDQKDIWLFPMQLAKRNHWAPTLAVTGATAGLIVADPHVMPYFQTHTRNLVKLNEVFGSTITTAEVVGVPVSLLIAGYARGA